MYQTVREVERNIKQRGFANTEANDTHAVAIDIN